MCLEKTKCETRDLQSGYFEFFSTTAEALFVVYGLASFYAHSICLVGIAWL